MHFKIKEPMWKTYSVGLNVQNLDKSNTIEIMYKDKQGRLMFPHKYSLDKDETYVFPRMCVKGVILSLVPIKYLEMRRQNGRENRNNDTAEAVRESQNYIQL